MQRGGKTLFKDRTGDVYSLQVQPESAQSKPVNEIQSFLVGFR